MRQLTFIKDSKTGMRRDGSGRNTPGSQNGSPRRAVPTSAVFLCSSRCQELKLAAQPPKRLQVKNNQASPKEQQVQKQNSAIERRNGNMSRAISSERDVATRRPARRTSSESPCRAAQRSASNRVNNTKQQRETDTFKRHASSPSINILSRVTSRSSLRSSSSDSSGRAKSEREELKKKGSKSRKSDNRVTWRRIRDEDVPQILKSTLPENALPLVPSPIEEKAKLPTHPGLPGKLPTILLESRKTSDATVQTEEEEASPKTNSGTSAVEKAEKLKEERLSKKEGDSEVSHTQGAVHFRQGSPSKSARITPFNYVPSPIVLQETINEKSEEKTES